MKVESYRIKGYDYPSVHYINDNGRFTLIRIFYDNGSTKDVSIKQGQRVVTAMRVSVLKK